ncbi:hypothetical protein GWO43_07900 [candidate division KSB1 bacterium]|nr:hypothetical protein [candidate division KSB1 bacterium]NIS23892.1 hypothetical protein [candidate division KSB1 bacterium]NIT70809.1 hypothetical protein [candidate division KSB1 bacterium]NIU24541.1 hypothetical protein [candidate division KSB1 bacterium]NIU94495.1 hypothetical protein [candidate division KSB1 bacterium]
MSPPENVIRDLEKKIVDGLSPYCPLCGSNLKIGERQQGKSGAYGYNYECRKDRDNDCSLKPGFAYIPWYTVLVHALQQKVFQIALIAIGSITIAGLGGIQLGFIKFGKSGESPAQNSNPTARPRIDPTENADNDSLSRMIADIELYKEKIALGIYFAKHNTDKCKEILYDVLENHEEYLNNKEKVEVIEALVSLRNNLKDQEDFERIIDYAKAHLSNEAKFRNLALMYWAYGDFKINDFNLFRRYRLLCLENYLSFGTKKPFTPQMLTDSSKLIDALKNTYGLLEMWDEDKIAEIKRKLAQGKLEPHYVIEFKNHVKRHSYMKAEKR